MAKAQLTTKAGTLVTVEGTPQEVAALVAQIEGAPLVKEKSSPKARKTREKEASRAKATPVNLITSLIDGGFFRKPKDLASIKVALQEMGHFFPVTSLSPAMLRFVRKRELRRLRDNSRWMYTGGA